MSTEHHVEYAPPEFTPAPTDDRAWYGAMMLAALLALLPFLAVTGSGLAISPDSTQYLSAARNVIEGNGLVAHWWAGTAEPLTHFPPLYPFVLAAVGTIIRADPLIAAWVLNLVLLVTNVMLVGLLATKASGGRLPIGAAAALVTAVMVDVARAHAFALTEPLFITLALLTFAALARGLEREDDPPSSRRALLSAAVLAGLAALTRYAGIVLIVVGATALLLCSDADLRSRLRRTVMFGLVAALPLALWLVHNIVVGGSASNRELTVHPMTREQIERGMSTVFSWLAPHVTWQAPRVVVGIVLFAILTIAAVEVLRARHRFDLRRYGELPRVLLLFVALYATFLVVSISFVDRQTELEPRILLPALFALILLVVPTLARLGDEPGMPRSPTWSRIVRATLALFVLLSGAALVDWSRTARREGIGLQVTATRAAPMLTGVAALPPNVRLYSNMPDVIHHFTGRVVVGLPRRVDPTSMRPNPHFDEQLAAIDDVPVPTFVIYFRDSADRWFVATDAEVNARVRLRPHASFPSGLVSEVEPSSDSSLWSPSLP